MKMKCCTKWRENVVEHVACGVLCVSGGMLFTRHSKFKIQILMKSGFHSENKGEMCTVKNEKNMWRKMDGNRRGKESANHFECL